MSGSWWLLVCVVCVGSVVIAPPVSASADTLSRSPAFGGSPTESELLRAQEADSSSTPPVEVVLARRLGPVVGFRNFD